MNAEPFPIRPTALLAENFRGWLGRHELAFGDDLTLLVGTNGAGKSSTLNAVEWCLFGSEIAKKSSGIDERGEWEVAHQRAEGPVSVTLTLATREGPVRMTRTRTLDAKPRDPDEVRLELGDDEVLLGEEVGDWMRWNSLPDWGTWKHAFCQHQELLRGRITDSGERSLQLGALLGLEAYQELSDRLKGMKPRGLAKVAQAELASIEEELQRSLDRPRRELRELEDRLEQRGLARTEIGEPALVAHAERMLAEGSGVAKLLDRETSLPDEATCTQEDVLRWARDWEPQLNLRRGEIEKELGALRRELQGLESALQGIEPARRRWLDASASVKRWSEEYGSAEELERQLGDLQRDREALQAEEREHDALRQLLRQATEVMRGHDATDCPVCGHHDPTLAETLRRELTTDVNPLKERFAAIDGRERQLNEQRKTLARLQSELELAETAHASLQKALDAQLPAGGSETKEPPEEIARQRRARITGLQGVLGRLEEFLGPHRADAEVLELLLKWRAARARADAATGGLDQLEEWNELQRAIDEAAGLVCDLEVIGAMSREAQRDRSSEGVTEANTTLGRHFARIRGGPDDEAVRVKVKSTATKLTYHLVDSAGRDVMPILNQAALNALSFAMLFAQAEERATRGEPRWLVLDDPGQNLDAENTTGLAEAVADIAQRVPVLVATHPGVLADAIERFAAGSGRCYRLTPGPGDEAPKIQEGNP